METKDGSSPRFEVVPLFERPDLIMECVRLLNSQWPRSETARIRMLEQCRSDSLPTSLMLILQDGSSSSPKVVGHSKISPVPSRPTECFVESVVIDVSVRGQGLGRLIMDGTEQFAKKRGIKTMHLTTHDQQGFYGKLGYEFSEPVVVYGGVSPKLQQIISSSHTCSLPESPKKSDSNTSGDQTDQEAISKPSGVPKGPPLPPPPPPPPMLESKPTQSQMNAIKTFMSKTL